MPITSLLDVRIWVISLLKILPKYPITCAILVGVTRASVVSTIRVFLRKLKALKWADRLWVWLHWSIIISSGKAGALQYLRMPEMPIMRILVIQQNMVRGWGFVGLHRLAQFV